VGTIKRENLMLDLLGVICFIVIAALLMAFFRGQ
jgi:hypothetical protein